jgi:hypothetical protein
MPETYLLVLPEDPQHIPARPQVAALATVLQELVPDADGIASEEADTVGFYDCGAGFRSVHCPGCDGELHPDDWTRWMAEDFDEEAGFRLSSKTLPCCQPVVTLQSLRYDQTQGFARFAMEVENPGVEQLDALAVAQLAGALECPVRLVFRTD